MKKEGNFRVKLLILFLAIAIAFIAIKYFRNGVAIAEILTQVEELGLWAPVSYIVLYILTSGILVPSTVIKIFAGTLFGIVWGVVLVSLGATISSSLKFIFARYLFRRSLQEKIERNQKLKAIDQVIEKDGWKMLIILRNIPIINSMLLNYICGLTKMKFKVFALVSFIGRLPTTIMYVYLGYMVRYAYTREFLTDSGKYLGLEKIMLFMGLVATVAACFYLIHLSRAVLSKKAPAITAE